MTVSRSIHISTNDPMSEKKDKSTRQMGDYHDILIMTKARLKPGFISIKGPY